MFGRNFPEFTEIKKFASFRVDNNNGTRVNRVIDKEYDRWMKTITNR